MSMKIKKFNKSVLGVIPSRFASTRLPGKPLVLIHGKPMVQWVYESAKKVLSNVVVATDDRRVFDAVKSFGGEVLMTPASCASGTDRMAAVARKIHATYYVNIQGDEPMMNPQTIFETVSLAIQKKSVATAAITFPPKESNNPSAVKVILGENKQAIYFSRAMIPYQAHGVTKPLMPLKHLGLYVYPKKSLFQFVKWAPSELEKTEKLEQLRALHHGMPIYVTHTRFDSIGVDTPADLKKVSALLK